MTTGTSEPPAKAADVLVLCAGMPRSGSTLQYNLCKELLGERVEVDRGWMPAPLLEGSFEPDWVAPGAGHVLVKCHVVPTWVDEIDASALRVVTTYRDLRDVAASGREFRPDAGFGRILEVLDRSVHQLSALEGRAEVLVQRYEALIADLEGAVRELAPHLGCQPSDVEVIDIARRWQAGEVKRGLGSAPLAPAGYERVWDPQTQLRPTHISAGEGRAGRFEGVLTTDEIRTIEERYDGWLRSHGYA